ncbi:MAG: 4-(cytidine 5'-diphospho)-2-C-methyl-D-erythritol kinase [Albidovulum sp.]|uniref:4-(cytidine 5'-diphospho)-2-C-methyl-D-erythritol kinase n=1 Tax=Albidovulum sp. TaxID=1872424 RepID=UPI003C945F8E
MTAEVFAPAKVNLALHVTGQRADGYHLLDSLVVFAGFGDTISVSPSDPLTLTITGPEGHALTPGEDNLVLRAARSFGTGHGAAITLTKRLPIASGIGGGSADAAATLKALARHWDQPFPPADVVTALGADVPVCLAAHPARMSGIGDVIGRVPDLPDGIALLLVNPRVAVSTPAVFRALPRKDNPPLSSLPARFGTAQALATWLSAQRNDLEALARALEPVIGDVLTAIAGTDSLHTRMSGSGATCFGLFPNIGLAEAAAAAISTSRPDWWVQAAPMLR